MHPTVKPVAMLADAIRDVTKRGAIVLDPFAGSGSTLIAAEKTGRQARCIEYEPKYCDVIVRRWQAYTGKAATFDGTDLTFEDFEGARASLRQLLLRSSARPLIRPRSYRNDREIRRADDPTDMSHPRYDPAKDPSYPFYGGIRRPTEQKPDPSDENTYKVGPGFRRSEQHGRRAVRRLIQRDGPRKSLR